MKQKLINIVMIISSLIVMANTEAATLPLSANLIALNSTMGQLFFSRSQNKADFWPLSLQFVTQQNLSYCAIASSVMILNALDVKAPADTANYGSYRIFTQDNFFTDAVRKIITPEKVRKHGTTLDELGRALTTFNVAVKVVHANQTTMENFRKAAISAIQNKNNSIIVNFLRTGLGEQGGGHMSPLAAYDKKTDRFLMLDVARYKYPPVWVTTKDLWRAMDTSDMESKIYRGFVLVSYGEKSK